MKKMKWIKAVIAILFSMNLVIANAMAAEPGAMQEDMVSSDAVLDTGEAVSENAAVP